MTRIPVIFYGAGERARYYADILQRKGIIPVCFADRDESKHGDVLLNKPILSLSEAVSKYPNAEVYITTTPEKWEQISTYLVGTGLVQLGKIKRLSAAKRKSCRWIMLH